MSEHIFSPANTSDSQWDGEAKRPYVTPKLEHYGSVAGMTRNVVEGYAGKDVAYYSL
jgi:hypothetical protein